MRTVGLLLVLSIALLLTACGGPPSSSEMERLLTQELQAGIDEEWLELEDFERLDWTEENEKSYLCEVEYDLVYLMSSKEIEQLKRQGVKQGRNPLGALGEMASMLALSFAHGEFQAGDKKHRKHQVRFEKWENGWRVGAAK